MKTGSTLFLRVTVLLMGLIVLTLCAFVLPVIYREWAGEYPDLAFLQYPVLVGLSATTIPFFIALHQTLRLLSYIDRNKAFSRASVIALKKIKYCALIISGLYVFAMPLVYRVADSEDAPGLMVMGMFFAFAPLVIAVFAAVVERLLGDAIAIKSENELTV
jgi:hypothetical protein